METTISSKRPMNKWPEIKDVSRKMHLGAYGFGDRCQLTMYRTIPWKVVLFSMVMNNK